MTLLDAVSIEPAHTLEHSLADALGTVPGALALAITKSPSGIYGICVLDESRVDFYDAEQQAIEAFLGVRRAHPEAAVDLLCVSRRDASQMEPEPSAQIYRFA